MAKKRKAKKKKNQRRPAVKKHRFPVKWMVLGLLAAGAALAAFWPSSRGVETLTYQLVNKLPHDADAYTQGLLYHRGYFYESTGLNGKTSLRKVDPASGHIVKRKDLDVRFFGEGLAFFNGVLIQLTYQRGTAFVYDSASFETLREHRYQGEGWGLTSDGTHLIMSDGSDRLVFRDPHNFKIVKSLRVTENGQPLARLNELEFVDGEIWANIYQTKLIKRISPKNGRVTGSLNCGGLLTPADRNGREDVLNGIAQNPETGNFFLTGKNYSFIYEVQIKTK